MREIDVEDAASWTDEEFADNILYLESRTRYAEAASAKAVRAEGPGKSKSKGKNETPEEG